MSNASGVTQPSGSSDNSASPTLHPRSESNVIELLPTPDSLAEIYEQSTCERHEDIHKLWIRALIPLVGHFIFIIGIATVVFSSIDNQLFNTSLRAPPVTQFDGSISHLASRPLQSDITTVLSIALTLMRTATAMWTAATTWRCVFVLMEKKGISLQAINWMTTFRLPPKPRTWLGVIVAIILLAAFPAQYSSPILTGSITWEPALKLVQGSQPVTISLSADGQSWLSYRRWSDNVEEVILVAAGAAGIAWNNSIENPSTMKRVLRNTQNLPINSILDNVTVPYFTIDAFEWIKDPDSILSDHDKQAFMRPSVSRPYISANLIMGFIPDGAWGPSTGPSSNFTFPSPTTISETRILAILHYQAEGNVSCSSRGYFGGLPTDVMLYKFVYQAGTPKETFIECIAYARVTYTAGAAVCRACRFSALTVVQNDTPVDLKPDAMTADALVIMPRLLTYMHLTGVSVPSSSNITNYIIHVLPRSYGAAWTALTDTFASSAMLKTDVMVPVSMSRARVLHWRVYVWVALNLLLTFSGILFIFVQGRCQKPLVVDTSIAAVLLDTSRVLANDQQGLCDLSLLTEEDSKIGPLRLQEEHGHRFVNVDK